MKKHKEEWVIRNIKLSPENYKSLKYLKIELGLKNLGETMIFLHKFYRENNIKAKINNAIKRR